MGKRTNLSIGICLLALSSLLLTSCASFIKNKRYAHIYGTAQKWDEQPRGSGIFFCDLDEYRYVVSVHDRATCVLAFWFCVLPMIVLDKDELRLSFWVQRGEKELAETDRVSISEPLFQMEIGSQKQDLPSRARCDPPDYSWLIARNVTVHFNELHIRDTKTGESKRVLLPPLEFYTGKTIKAGIGVVGHGEETPVGWLGIMITVALYGFVIRSIVRRIRKTNSA